jgi:hypothetical protein
MSESDIEDFSESGDDDSEGSLVDFIVPDNEVEMEVGGEGGEEDEEVEEDNEVEMEVENEEEDEEEIKRQYNPSLESQGIVTNSAGLRRSTRANKGRPPVKYIDDEYLQLMTDDVGSDIDKLSSSEEEEDEEDEDEDFELEEDD